MLTAGNLLLDALAIEQSFRVKYGRKPAPESLRRWRKSRRTVARLAHEYAAALMRYRRGMKAKFAGRLSD